MFNFRGAADQHNASCNGDRDTDPDIDANPHTDAYPRAAGRVVTVLE
jgi:hypothetical protein